ncbi:MAG TPA: WD40 repeat domain-containing protein, partial [Ktedonobacteraceae bacterium]|nr:WD40 repeat domain-containing protein [Ktedonobacteraceae bacterium]
MHQALSRSHWTYPALGALLCAITLCATFIASGTHAATLMQQHGLLIPSSLPAPGIRWRFDGGYVDESSRRLYQTDTTNASVHLFDLATRKEIGLIRGFAGLSPMGIDHNGPNHVLGIGQEIAVSDGDGTIKIFDVQSPTHPQLRQTMWLGGTGRTDAMAWDGEHQVLAAVNSAPADSFVTFLSTRPWHILKKMSFTAQDIHGLDDIRFDPLTHHFFLSAESSGTPSTPYPYGALVELSSQRVIHTYAIPYVCDPAGLATHDGTVALACAS